MKFFFVHGIGHADLDQNYYVQWETDCHRSSFHPHPQRPLTWSQCASATKTVRPVRNPSALADHFPFESLNPARLRNVPNKKPPSASDFTWLQTGVKLLQNGHYQNRIPLGVLRGRLYSNRTLWEHDCPDPPAQSRRPRSFPQPRHHP